MATRRTSTSTWNQHSDPAASELGTDDSGIELMTNQPRSENPPFNYGAYSNRRLEIENDPKLKLHLKVWEDEKKQEVLSIESYRGRCNAAKTELYQLMGFYSVFQGVVFTAVASPGKLTCKTSLCPALLSLLTSIATVISVHFKLFYYETQKLKFIKAQNGTANIKNKIAMMKGNGKNFRFEDLNDSMDSEALKHDLKREAKSHRLFYRAVMLFLAGFSFMILASCVIVLCWDQGKDRLRSCTSTLCW